MQQRQSVGCRLIDGGDDLEDAVAGEGGEDRGVDRGQGGIFAGRVWGLAGICRHA